MLLALVALNTPQNPRIQSAVSAAGSRVPLVMFGKSVCKGAGRTYRLPVRVMVPSWTGAPLLDPGGDAFGAVGHICGVGKITFGKHAGYGSPMMNWCVEAGVPNSV